MYFREDQAGKVYIALYVDDGLILTTSKILLNEILSQMRVNFEITVGDSEYFLGMQVKRDRIKNNIFVNQSMYIENILVRFNLADANSLSMPADSNSKLKASDYNDCDELYVPYREDVGTLLFLAIASRPDIAYAVGIVSRYLDKYDISHWNAVKRIMCYLSKTRNRGILYEKCNEFKLIGYSDSDYAADADTCRSTSGYIFKLSNGSITWSSKRQSTVSLSTTEAEYIAACLAVKEAIWLRKLLFELGHMQHVFTSIIKVQ